MRWHEEQPHYVTWYTNINMSVQYDTTEDDMTLQAAIAEL